MSAALTADSGNIPQIADLIEECKRLDIPVLPPSINESFQGFSVVRKEGEKDTIRFGLTTIKNFGEGIANTIVKERKERGRFISLTDFLRRIKDKNLNKKSLEALIKSGALDDFEERGTLLHNLDLLLEYHKEVTKEQNINQDSLFGGLKDKISDLSLKSHPEAPISDRLSWEKELLGLYISGHPLDKFKEKLGKLDTDIQKIKKEPKEGKEVMLVGLVEEMREVITKKNEYMAFVTLQDLTDRIDCVVFPKTFESYKNIIKKDALIAIIGKVSLRNNEVSIIIEKAKLCD